MSKQTASSTDAAPKHLSSTHAAMMLVLASLATVFVALAAPAAAAKSGAPLAEGALETVSKRTSGMVQIEEREDGRYLVFSDDFRTGSGPDVLVLLHRDATPTSYGSADYVSLGLIQSFRGGQSFRLPDDAKIGDFQSVVLWCRQFNVTFGVDQLRR